MNKASTRLSADSRKGNTPKLEKSFLSEAKAAHTAIVHEVRTIGKRWASLERKIQEFREAGFHKAITDPKTGKPFQKFAKWAKFVFGQSESTIFANARLVRELTGIVPDQDVNSTKKENLEQVVRLKKANKAITTEVVEAAKSMSAREFRAQVVEPQLPAADQRPVLEQLGPYSVSGTTAKQFEKALRIAEWVVARDAGSGPVRERALAALASVFVAAHGAEYDLAHGSQRKPIVTKRPPASVAVPA